MAVPGCQQGSVTQVHQLPGAQVCKCRCVPQHLKKSQQMETEMLYGSTPRTPIKRRMLSPHAPAKVSKVKWPCRACLELSSPWAGAQPWAGLGPAGRCGEGRGAAAPWKAVLCDLCSAFSSAPHHLHHQCHTQQHRSLSLWGSHLPLAHSSVATLWEKGEGPWGESLPRAELEGTGELRWCSSSCWHRMVHCCLC